MLQALLQPTSVTDDWTGTCLTLRVWQPQCAEQQWGTAHPVCFVPQTAHNQQHGLQAGLKSAALASAAVGVTNVLGSTVAASLMDRAGRKQLLTLSFGGMGAAMLLMAAGLGLPQLAELSGPIALFGTLAYILSFALGAGPVPGLLVPEITPTRLRGTSPRCLCQEGQACGSLHLDSNCGINCSCRTGTSDHGGCSVLFPWDES